MEGIMKTSTIIKKMLLENTGINMLDSGGDSNRAWQRNQGRAFDKEPRATIGSDGVVSLSTYHFLIDHLEFCPELDKKFKAFSRKSDECHLNDMESWVDTLEAAGLYGEGEPFTVNTYNHESLTDQVLQFVYFSLAGQDYVILSIHNGADVRGGYTAPRVFKVDEMFLSDSDAIVYCPDHEFQTDDGYHFYHDGSSEGGTYELISDSRPICGKKLEAR
jgi:hypothetical protein